MISVAHCRDLQDKSIDKKQKPMELWWVKFQGAPLLKCEVAQTNAQREKGLMYRKKLDFDKCMVFVFEREKVLHFWMKNTFIPLDIVFLDEKQVVVSHAQMKPHDLSSVSSKMPATYAIEMNAGWFQHYGLSTGVSALFSPVD